MGLPLSGLLGGELDGWAAGRLTCSLGDVDEVLDEDATLAAVCKRGGVAYAPRVSEDNDSQAAKVWKPARDCLHDGTCSSRNGWLCHHDGLHFRAGYESRQWRCFCGPCHDAADAPSERPAALVFKNEPATVFSIPAPACACACACGAPATRATWWETAAHDMVSPVTYACDEHQAQAPGP
jgi:hypothetical protein